MKHRNESVRGPGKWSKQIFLKLEVFPAIWDVSIEFVYAYIYMYMYKCMYYHPENPWMDDSEWMNEWKGIYVPFNAVLGYIGTATSEGINWRMIVRPHTSHWSKVSWPATLTTRPRRRSWMIVDVCARCIIY